ncbi:MAG: UDP-3-O-(3-hydroxymyristoyl)glucosamine N-acyltransferase [Ferruginibacter sp.]
MQFTAQQIADFLQGTVEGSSDVTVSAFGKIEEAKSGELSFLANPKYEDYLYNTGASVVIVNNSLVLKQPVSSTLIRVQDAYLAFASLLELYQQQRLSVQTGIEQPVFIHETATIGEHVYIGAFAYIGAGAQIGNHTKIFPGAYIGQQVKIGDQSILHAGVKIYHDCVIGHRVIIHANTVVGSDGFGFAPQPDGSLKKVPQTGNVVVEDDVEIGAQTTIDRATIGRTIVRKGSKLDNLVQIAHNVDIGENTVIAAQTGISGSTKIGKQVMIGGQTGVVGHIQIADGCKINGQSGVTKSIKHPGMAVTGTPAQEFTASLRAQAMLRKLPDLEKRIKDIEEMLKQQQ